MNYLYVFFVFVLVVVLYCSYGFVDNFLGFPNPMDDNEFIVLFYISCMGLIIVYVVWYYNYYGIPEEEKE